MLESLITSKTRLRLLVKFFVNQANKAHMRGLADELNESTNAIRKELNNLSEAGYLEKKSEGNKINYYANTEHPLFSSLQDIVRKYLGLDQIVEKILLRMGQVEQVWLIGDYAKGIDSGKIEVVVVGKELNADYVRQLEGKIEDNIGRKIKIYLKNEFLDKGLLLFNAKA